MHVYIHAYIPIEGKDAIPIKRISSGEPGARGLQHPESVPPAEVFHTALLGFSSCLPATGITLYKIGVECCRAELGEACVGDGSREGVGMWCADV